MKGWIRGKGETDERIDRCSEQGKTDERVNGGMKVKRESAKDGCD